MLTWRVLACAKPGGARGSAFDSKSKGWWFDSTPGFRSGSLLGTIPSSSSFLSFFFLLLLLPYLSFLFSSSCTCLPREYLSRRGELSRLLFFQKAPEKPSLHQKIKAPVTSSERGGLFLRTDNTQPLPPSCGGLGIHHFSSSSTKRMRPREFFSRTTRLTLILTLHP